MSKTSYQREYRKNMTDEQKQRYREARIHKYHNMTNEQKQRYKDYQIKYKENILMNKNKNIENLKSDIEKI